MNTPCQDTIKHNQAPTFEKVGSGVFYANRLGGAGQG